MIYFVSPTSNDGSAGTMDSPWQTIENSVNKLASGDILYIRGGEYVLQRAILCQKSGTQDKPIVYAAFEDEKPVIKADKINFFLEKERYPFGHETGAIFIYKVEHIIIRGVYMKNSHGHGIAVRDSNNITIDGCTIENTFCCGISLWDTDSTRTICHHNKVIGNTVIKATTWDMLPEGMKKGNEPPHEAISIAGACDFEVAYNHVHNCDKEGIDVKEVSHHGSVHHNHVHHVDRQGLYADAWFGPLTNVDFHDNIVHDCKGAGIVIANLIIKMKGESHRSPFIDNMAFGAYNKKYKPAKTKFDWLSRDEAVVEEYIADPLCGFLFTAPAYRDMFALLKGVSSNEAFAKIPSDLPVYLIAGADDPVGSYGEGVKKVHAALLAAGHKKAEIKLYENCRHEILNELNKDEIYEDILDWINSK